MRGPASGFLSLLSLPSNVLVASLSEFYYPDYFGLSVSCESHAKTVIDSPKTLFLTYYVAAMYAVTGNSAYVRCLKENYREEHVSIGETYYEIAKEKWKEPHVNFRDAIGNIKDNYHWYNMAVAQAIKYFTGVHYPRSWYTSIENIMKDNGEWECFQLKIEKYDPDGDTQLVNNVVVCGTDNVEVVKILDVEMMEKLSGFMYALAGSLMGGALTAHEISKLLWG